MCGGHSFGVRGSYNKSKKIHVIPSFVAPPSAAPNASSCLRAPDAWSALEDSAADGVFCVGVAHNLGGMITQRPDEQYASTQGMWWSIILLATTPIQTPREHTSCVACLRLTGDTCAVALTN